MVSGIGFFGPHPLELVKKSFFLDTDIIKDDENKESTIAIEELNEINEDVTNTEDQIADKKPAEDVEIQIVRVTTDASQADMAGINSYFILGGFLLRD